MGQKFRLTPELKFQAPAPGKLSVCIDVVHRKLETIIIFAKLAFPTNYVCGTGTQISGSGSTAFAHTRFGDQGHNKGGKGRRNSPGAE